MELKSLIENVSRTYLFPALLLATLGLIFILWKLDYTPNEWIEYTYNGIAITLLLLEFVIPRNKAWNYINRNGFKFKETGIEIFFFFFSGFFAGAVTYPFSNWVADGIRAASGMEFHISLPLVAQVIVLVLMIDFIRYWMHRWMHERAILWRFHALHHLPERLGVATSTRTHPVDDFLLYVPEMIVLFTIGFNRTLVAVLYCFIWVISLIKHSNVDIQSNWFSKHFQIPQFHLSHHKKHDGRLPTSNFSEILTFWDRVFRTFEGPQITTDHQVGVPSETKRGFLREFFGWAYLPTGKM